MGNPRPRRLGAKLVSHLDRESAKPGTQLQTSITVEPALFVVVGSGTTIAVGQGDLDRENPNMVASAHQHQELLRNRNKTVAKSFYRQLKTEGFSHEQIIELSTTLLDLVTEDIQTPTPPDVVS